MNIIYVSKSNKYKCVYIYKSPTTHAIFYMGRYNRKRKIFLTEQ